MSVASGNFDCAALLQTVVKIDTIWADSAANRIDYITEAASAKAVLSNTTATFSPLEDKEKKRSVKIVWLADCAGDEPILTDDRCIAGGQTIESDCKEYELGDFEKRGFTIEQTQFETSMFSKEEVLAKAMLRRMKQLDEAIGRKIIAKILTFKGINQFDGGIGDVSGSDTYISSTSWDANMFGYLTQVAILNRIPSPYLLTGNNLFQQKWQIDMQTSNPQNGTADKNKLSVMPIYADLFNMESVAPSTTIMVDRSAVAFASRSVNPSVPVTYDNGANVTFFSVPSKNIPGLTYDVTYKTRCLNDKIYHDYSIYAHFDTFHSPLACNVNMKQILTFICGEA